MAWLLLSSFFSVATVDVVAVDCVTVVAFSSCWALTLGPWDDEVLPLKTSGWNPKNALKFHWGEISPKTLKRLICIDKRTWMRSKIIGKYIALVFQILCEDEVRPLPPPNTSSVGIGRILEDDRVGKLIQWDRKNGKEITISKLKDETVTKWGLWMGFLRQCKHQPKSLSGDERIRFASNWLEHVGTSF